MGASAPRMQDSKWNPAPGRRISTRADHRRLGQGSALNTACRRNVQYFEPDCSAGHLNFDLLAFFAADELLADRAGGEDAPLVGVFLTRADQLERLLLV